MRWLCLDPGARRTGVAISSPEGTFAVPLLVLEHDPAGPSLDAIARLMREHGADGLVLGLPISMDGSSSSQTLAALDFARRVALYFNTVVEMPPGVALPESFNDDSGECAPTGGTARARVLLWDERLTSWEAQRIRAAGDAPGRKRTGRERALDAHAAAIILQSFLDAHSDESAGTVDMADTVDEEYGSPD